MNSELVCVPTVMSAQCLRQHPNIIIIIIIISITTTIIIIKSVCFHGFIRPVCETHDIYDIITAIKRQRSLTYHCAAPFVIEKFPTVHEGSTLLLLLCASSVPEPQLSPHTESSFSPLSRRPVSGSWTPQPGSWWQCDPPLRHHVPALWVTNTRWWSSEHGEFIIC